MIGMPWPISLAALALLAVATDDAGRVDLQRPPLRQLVRELLLAQSSDWAFLIRNGTAKDYATRRVTDHLSRFQKLAEQFEKKDVDAEFLAQCEEQDNLFPHLNWRVFL